MNEVPHGKDDGSTSLTMLQRAKRNEAEAWQRLVGLYTPLVYLRCRSQWGFLPSDSEQLGQEVFSAVARKLADFERQRTGSFRSWLRAIVDSKCKDELRKKTVATAVGGTHAKQRLESAVFKSDPPDEIQAERNERSILMKQAMNFVESEISARDWKIFWRVAVDEMNRKSVAQEFEVSDNVVYIVCSRIQKRLKLAFQDLLDNDLFGRLAVDERQS